MCNFKNNINSINHISDIEIPFIYVFSHYLIGYLGYYNKTLIVLFVVYQMYQYTLDKRFYLIPYCMYNDNTGANGNTLKHTIIKLTQGFGGFLIAYAIHSLCNKFFQ